MNINEVKNRLIDIIKNSSEKRIEKLKKLKSEIEETFKELENDEEITNKKEIDLLNEIHEEKTDKGNFYFPLLLEAIREIDNATSQKSILKTIVKTLNQICEEYYFLVLKGENIVIWEGKTKNISKNELKLFSIPFSLSTSINFVINNSNIYEGEVKEFTDENFIAKKLGKAQIKSVFVVPLVLRGKAVAVIYIDTSEEAPLEKEFIEILLRHAGISIDMLPIKMKITEKLKEKKEKTQEDQETKVGAQQKAEESPSKTEEHESITLKEEEEEETQYETPEHRAAKRLARVIISDLISYYKEKIEEGKRKGNIYNEIKNEIEQAAKHFYSRIEEKVWKKRNYFEKYLIEKIAEGNKNLLEGFNFRSE